jgi:hypothetical protein
MLAKLNGVAFLGLYGDSPRTIDMDRSGRPCEAEHACLTGTVRPLSFASSRAVGAAAIHRVRPTESASSVAKRLKGETLRYQTVVGELEVVSVPMPALLADDNGRGEPPWDRMAELDEHVAIELQSRLTGIRELRLRPLALTKIELSPAIEFEPGDHVEEILAAARRLG